MSRKKTKARQRAVQALYQWQLTGQDPHVICEQFSNEQDMSKVDVSYFGELVKQVPCQIEALDEIISPLIDRAISDVDPVERAVLRLGAYELQFSLSVPSRVAINEGVELAKMFGADQSHRYINGVLDKIAKQLRPSEMKKKK